MNETNAKWHEYREIGNYWFCNSCQQFCIPEQLDICNCCSKPGG